MSKWINAKTMGALVAATVAAGGATYVKIRPNAVAPPKAERVIYQPRPAQARSWGSLSAAELVVLNATLVEMVPTKIEIYCPGNWCRDMAEDLDEAFESAGFDSYLVPPIFDIGKGVGISPDTKDVRTIADAIRIASGGAVDLKVFDPVDDKGNKVDVKDKIVIALARRAALPQPK